MRDIDTVNKILKQNNLKRDTYKLVANQDVLKDLGIKYGNILNRSSLIKILGTLKENHGVPERTSLSLLTHYLQNVLKLFSKIELYSEKKGEKVTRYISTYVKVSPYEIALSLLSNSFLSHYSALYVHDLTINNPKEIYINREQSKKPINKENAILTQRKVDYAFSKEMRQTNDIYNFAYQGIYYKVHILNAKNTNKTGIIKKTPIGFSKAVQVTNRERTLLDCTIRPRYSGGAIEVLEAYYAAKTDLIVPLLADYLKKFDYIYPYEKSVLFYLKNTNYPKHAIAIIEDMLAHSPNRHINFYVDYQIPRKKEDETIGIFYPSEIDEVKIEYYDSHSAQVKVRRLSNQELGKDTYQIGSVHLYDSTGEELLTLDTFTYVYDNYEEIMLDISRKFHVLKENITIIGFIT